MRRREEAAPELELKDRALDETAEGITIADALLPDMPLIYANRGFERLTGYAVEEVLGRNCRFLQGPGTDPAALNKLRSAIRERRECTVLLLNYRKDGSAFWNRLAITPVHDPSGRVTHFIGVQSDVTEQKLAEEALQAAKRDLEAANQRMSWDLQAAATVQQALLPQAAPGVKEARFAWVFRPCTELAGDMFNLFFLSDQEIGLYILDVSGHGVAAALLSVTLSHVLSPFPGQSILFTPKPSRPGEYSITPPAEVVRRLNRQFRLDPRTAQYFTIVYGVFHRGTREFRYCSAGHMDPLVLPPARKPAAPPVRGAPIGLLPEADYQEQTIRLSSGDRLVLFTDGVVETENRQGEEFGARRLMNALQGASHCALEEALARAMSSLEEWCGCTGFPDDASILAFQVLD